MILNIVTTMTSIYIKITIVQIILCYLEAFLYFSLFVLIFHNKHSTLNSKLGSVLHMYGKLKKNVLGFYYFLPCYLRDTLYPSNFIAISAIQNRQAIAFSWVEDTPKFCLLLLYNDSDCQNTCIGIGFYWNKFSENISHVDIYISIKAKLSTEVMLAGRTKLMGMKI